MLRKSLILTALTLGAMTAGAINADYLFLLGPGTPSGWTNGDDNRDKIVYLAGDGNVKSTVAFLKNDGGRSFRLQTTTGFDTPYYGPATANEPIGLGWNVPVHETNDNTWTVPYAGIFHLDVNTAKNTIFVYQTDKLYIVGTVSGSHWALDDENLKEAALSLVDGSEGQYKGVVNLEDGSFKILIDASKKDWDKRFFLFRQDAGKFKTDVSGGDDQWTVGAGKDLNGAGRYRIELNTKDQSVSFTRLPVNVTLDGVSFHEDGYNRVADRPVFIKANTDFWVDIDGQARSTQVSESGWYILTAAPFTPGEWPIVYASSGPLDVYADGLCGLALNAEGTAYVNDDLNWREAGQNFTFKAGGYTLGTATVGASGYVEARMTLDGMNAGNCSLNTQGAYVKDYGLLAWDGSGYVNNDLNWRTAGESFDFMIGNHKVGTAKVSETGYQSARIAVNADKSVGASSFTAQGARVDGLCALALDADGTAYVNDDLNWRTAAATVYNFMIGDHHVGTATVGTTGYQAARLAVNGDKSVGACSLYAQAARVDGLCDLSLNAQGNGYVNSDLNWRQVNDNIDYNFYVGRHWMGAAKVTVSGWQRAVLANLPDQAQCRLEAMQPAVNGNGISYTYALENATAQAWVKPSLYFSAGEYTVNVGGNTTTFRIAKDGQYVLKLSDSNGAIVPVTTGPLEVNMPLKPEDFSNGKKHYFLVGQRTSAWRLQPEWEFTPAEDGTLTIPTRLLYNGYVMVAAVDNYDDYVAQRYRGYTHTDTNAESRLVPAHADGDFHFPLAAVSSVMADGKYRAVRYDNLDGTSPGVQNGSFEAMTKRMIAIYSSEGTFGSGHQQDRSSRVNTITLDLDGYGNPAGLHFNGVNGSPSEVIKVKTFSFVGSSIKNVDLVYDDNSVTSPLNRQDGYGGDAWSEAWIQYDSEGHPYIDAYGEYIYQTSFTSNWLKKHPSYFKDESGFEFTSNNITFFYDESATRPDQFGQRQWAITENPASDDDYRKELLYTYYNIPDNFEIPADELLGRNRPAAENLDDKMTVPASRRVCFVVDGMWFSGLFKIWAGWGGASTAEEYESGNRSVYTRWYRDNAGHGAWRSNRTAFYQAGTEMAFTLFEDIDAANFGIGYGLPGTDKVNADGSIKAGRENDAERRFYSRVEIWYDLENGLARTPTTSSFLIFKQERGAPVIHISKKDETHISYSYDIQLPHNFPADADERQFGDITYCLIERVLLDEQGNEKERTKVIEYSPGVLPAEFRQDNVLDDKSLAGGRYRYDITTKRANTGNELFTAKSNIVRIDGNGSTSGVEDVATDVPSATDNIARVYNIGGVLLRTVETDGSIAGVTNGLEPGVYVVRHNGRSIRVAVR